MVQKETATQRKRRLATKREKDAEKRQKQSMEQGLEENKKKRKVNVCCEFPRQERENTLAQRREQRASQAPEEREVTLAWRREQWASQAPEEREETLARRREQRATQAPEEREETLARRREQRASQAPEEREETLAWRREQRASQAPEEREATLARWREQWASQTPEEREVTLARRQQQRATQMPAETEFCQSINQFCTCECKICKKSCYQHQVTMVRPSNAASSYLPAELCNQTTLLLCSRCRAHVTNMKSTAPPKAYWNNLDPGPIPDCIKNLTEPEQRLLSRIIPFVKIIKFSGRFGQFGFKGQAVLFAQDIHEVTEKLPSMLPRSPNDAGILVVTEHLENLDVTREKYMT